MKDELASKFQQKFGFSPARGVDLRFPNVVDTELPELTSVKEGRNG